VAPGTYQLKLTVDGQTMTESFEVKADPRLTTSPGDFAKQVELGLKIRDKVSETHNAIIQIRDVRSNRRSLEASGWSTKLQSNQCVGHNAQENLASVEEALYQTKNQSSQDPLNYPIRLNNKLAALAGVVQSADAAPTDQSYQVYNELVVPNRCAASEAGADNQYGCSRI